MPEIELAETRPGLFERIGTRRSMTPPESVSHVFDREVLHELAVIGLVTPLV